MEPINNEVKQVGQLPQQDIVGAVPLEIAKLVLGHVNFNDRLRLATVSKRWKIVTDAMPEWIYKAGIVKCATNRSSISAHIQQQTILEMLAAPSRLIPVKTAQEFDAAAFRLRLNKQSTAILSPELQQKEKLHETIEAGLSNSLNLFLLKRVPFNTVEAYANVLEEKYGDSEIWMKLTHRLIQGNSWDRAKIIFDIKLKGTHLTESLLKLFIKPLCEQGKFDEAIAFFIENYTPNPHLSGSMSYEAEEAVDWIISRAKEAKQYGAVEKAIETIVPVDKKPSKIQSLVRTYVQQDLREKAEALYQKHTDFLNARPMDNYSAYALVEFHVLRGDLNSAWKITMERKKEDDFIVLKLMLLLQEHMPHQKQRIEELRLICIHDQEELTKLINLP